MKPSLTTKVLIWICNFALAVCLAAPFLHYLWYKIIESVPITMLRIEGALLSSTVGYAFKFELLIAGLVLVVIGKAFDYGVKLQKEQELTI